MNDRMGVTETLHGQYVQEHQDYHYILDIIKNCLDQTDKHTGLMIESSVEGLMENLLDPTSSCYIFADCPRSKTRPALHQILVRPALRLQKSGKYDQAFPILLKLSEALEAIAPVIPVDYDQEPFVRNTDDGATNLEWFADDDSRRLCFIFESDPKESGWHYVSKRSHGDDMLYGTFETADYKALLQKMT